MTAEQAIYLVLAIGGAVGAAYWRFTAAVGSIKDELAAHKLHTAETYVTKAGLREATDQIITAVNGVKTDVHSLNERIDRIIEHQQPARPRRSS